MLLCEFFLVFAHAADICKNEYTQKDEAMIRCYLSGTSSFSGQKQTAIYLHNKDKSAQLIIKPHKDPENQITIKAGHGIQIMKSDADVTCQSNSHNCFVTIWHTSYDKDQGRFASDGAGCSLFSDGSFIPNRFPLFFDFGDNARFQAGNFTHKRETGVTLYYMGYSNSSSENEELTYIEKTIKKNDIVNLDGPGILHISSTIYTKSEFNFIIGSTIKIPSDFSNSPASGNFSKYSFSDGKGEFVENPVEKADPAQIYLAREARAWYYLSIVMVCLTILTFILSVTSAVCIAVGHAKNKKNV
ncbi:hypothetical protein TRFO_01277 [Tritrichomonas foetus]|uniref:Uncharacterized protein n=1 Tax=Tritrichomonas foetus TaxID=1144522 RepID=A0A1J4K7I3_9EUKA|nr:hypothetical protein TRFO_01277 [Tritrichomonas foetus]|eukprot:OHT07155.1 hypothetical protein TRFO_01277 [Tritrichomonas foetus]